MKAVRVFRQRNFTLRVCLNIYQGNNKGNNKGSINPLLFQKMKERGAFSSHKMVKCCYMRVTPQPIKLEANFKMPNNNSHFISERLIELRAKIDESEFFSISGKGYSSSPYSSRINIKDKSKHLWSQFKGKKN